MLVAFVCKEQFWICAQRVVGSDWCLQTVWHSPCSAALICKWSWCSTHLHLTRLSSVVRVLTQRVRLDETLGLFSFPVVQLFVLVCISVHSAHLARGRYWARVSFVLWLHSKGLDMLYSLYFAACVLSLRTS